MNVVDSSGWLEYFADGPNAEFFAAAIEATDELVVPTVSVYEVFKRVLQQRGEGDALQAVALMQQGAVVDLTAPLALEAARVSVALGLPMADGIILGDRAVGAILWTQDADFAASTVCATLRRTRHESKFAGRRRRPRSEHQERRHDLDRIIVTHTPPHRGGRIAVRPLSPRRPAGVAVRLLFLSGGRPGAIDGLRARGDRGSGSGRVRSLRAAACRRRGDLPRSQRKGAHKASLWSLYVVPGARSTGLGRALVVAALDFAASLEGVTHVYVSATERAPEAMALYASLGFITWGVEPAALRVGDIAVSESHMVRTLAGDSA